MTASPFNAMHAAVDPRGILIRDHLREAGDAHGRASMALALDKVRITSKAVAAAVVEILEAECARMARVYWNAGCSRRQVAAFVLAFRCGALARNFEAMALLSADAGGNA